MKCCFWK